MFNRQKAILPASINASLKGKFLPPRFAEQVLSLEMDLDFD
jgi:hypothetical protein